MIFRLHRAGDRAEQILRRRRERHHTVALELAEADDGIGVIKIGSICKMPRDMCLREHGILLRKVMVQRRARFGHTGNTINTIQKRFVIQPAGAVADHDRCAPLLQGQRQRPQECRMRRGGGIGLHGRNEIRLDDDPHPRPHPRQPAERRQRLRQRPRTHLRRVAFTFHNRHIAHRTRSPSLRQF